MDDEFWNDVEHGIHWIHPNELQDGEPVRNIAWTKVFGEIPERWAVISTCDVPRCVSPYHMYLGSDIDITTLKRKEILDRAYKMDDRRVKLTHEDKMEIRRLSNLYGKTKLAHMFGVTRQHIYRVLSEPIENASASE